MRRSAMYNIPSTNNLLDKLLGRGELIEEVMPESFFMLSFGGEKRDQKSNKNEKRERGNCSFDFTGLRNKTELKYSKRRQRTIC